MCGVFEEFGRKCELRSVKNTLLKQMNKIYLGRDNSWIENCNSEQLQRGLDLILDGLNYNEFKRKIFE
ncbi:hypothetical protein [uncultured Thomasclavelia sp.]|uniref:hypothetical protein n=1 Tax=uncultured Thomasclavelia sp. TaxID=3025759 RepID=UPI0025F214DE|nr:hypothetical protein [uncultured Thomasclavelia sp.]